MNEKEQLEKFENDSYDKMRDAGYKDLNDYLFQKSYERAASDYERSLNNPYEC